MSHATEIKEADTKVEARMLRLLGEPAEWLYQLRYECGLAWLNRHAGYFPALEKALAEMPAEAGALRNPFWAWWLNAWQQLDATLSARLTVMSTGVAGYHAGQGLIQFIHDAKELNYFYRTAHDPKTMLVRLPSFVTEAAHRHLRNLQNQKQSTVQKTI